MEFCHAAAEVRSLLLQRQVERILQDVLIIHSHKELEIWILQEKGKEEDRQEDGRRRRMREEGGREEEEDG